MELEEIERRLRALERRLERLGEEAERLSRQLEPVWRFSLRWLRHRWVERAVSRLRRKGLANSELRKEFDLAVRKVDERIAKLKGELRKRSQT